MKKLVMGPDENAQLRKSLKKIKFLSDLTSVDVGALANQTQLHLYDEGSTIFKQGDSPEALYVILDGEVAIKYKAGLFKKTNTLDHLGPGHFFGEMALIAGSRRTATATTVKPTKLFVLNRSVIDEVLMQNDQFREHIRAVAETRKFLNGRHT
jgi:CRP-like cAMP-binding protein